MIESLKVKLNKGSKVRVIIMDLSKAFDSLNYRLDNNAASFLRSYLTNRLQRCKIKNSFIEWAKICAGVPQGSTLGLLFFNIFINDIFIFRQKCDLANYADDSTMYTSDKRVCTSIDSLSHEFTILSKCVYNEFMVLSSEKC